MSLSRSRTLYLALALVLAVLAVRPVAVVERVLDIALLPARVLGELAAPFSWWHDRAVRAAHSGAAASLEEEILQRAALERAVADSALPTHMRLPSAESALHGEVIARAQGNLDSVLVRIPAGTHVARGLPVVSGDYFVGVVDVQRAGETSAWSEVEVRLITDAEARIGGYLASDERGESCRLVVGGLAPRSDRIDLDGHNPSNRSSTSGQVVVYEPPDLVEGPTWLANGFVLGELYAELVDGKLVRGLRPGLDYKTGLNQVLILLPESQRPDALASSEELDSWIAARSFLRATPGAWRAGRKLAVGRLHGVLPGAALADGVRLVGRVERSGWLTCDARLVSDPGFRVPAVAMLARGSAFKPHVLGQLSSLGRDPEGNLRLLWPATLPLDAAEFGTASGSVRARLWSESGERGVPRGLLIGDVELPFGPGPHILHVRQPDGASDPAHVRVRRSLPEERS